MATNNFTNINSFTERGNAMELHSLFFDLESTSEVSFLLGHIEDYELLKKKKLKKLKALLKEVEDSSWDTIEAFDKSRI